jgi:hypothetical protein
LKSPEVDPKWSFEMVAPVEHDTKEPIMTITEHTTTPEPIVEVTDDHGDTDVVGIPTQPERRRPRRVPLLVGGAVLVACGVAAAVVVRSAEQGPIEPVEILDTSGRVPSGSPFDAPLPHVTQRVPSGSPYDAPLIVRRPTQPPTGHVPSGSPFDAPLPHVTQRVPSGSPFDAPLPQSSNASPPAPPTTHHCRPSRDADDQ